MVMILSMVGWPSSIYSLLHHVYHKKVNNSSYNNYITIKSGQDKLRFELKTETRYQYYLLIDSKFQIY